MRSKALLAALAMLLAGGAAAQPAATPAPAVAAAVGPLPLEWISRFEQAWGVVGVYVIEPGDPADPASVSRANLQTLQLAAEEFLRTRPTGTPDVESLRALGLVGELPRGVPDERYTWSAEGRRFVSSAGEPVSLRAVAERALAVNHESRLRYLRPTVLVRQRWAMLEADADAPGLIHREIEFRRVLDDLWEGGDVRAAKRCREQLAQIEAAALAYGSANRLAPGTPVTLRAIASQGLLDDVRRCPKNGEYSLAKLGEKPVCSWGDGHDISVPEGQALTPIRRAVVEQFYANAPENPAAVALAARFRPAPEAIAMLDAALARQPDSAALRLERMSHLASQGRAEELVPEIEWLLTRIPAAPVIFEIDLATSAGPLENATEFRAAVAKLLADSRPDLLSPQLRAISALRAAGRLEDARAVYDRLVRANPGYGDLLPRP
jgi:tetratricopeptide (TPR) repeat protein